MANHKTAAQRYNDRMDEIFARSKILKKKYGTEDSKEKRYNGSRTINKALTNKKK